MTLSKEYKLLIFSVVVLFIVIWKLLPVKVSPVLKAVLSVQRGSIKTVDDKRNIERSDSFYIDTISFEPGTTLVHSRLGPLGVSKDFFIDLEGRFEVKEGGTYLFSVTSDDGFRLKVDGVTISEFLSDRPMGETEGVIELTPGLHNFSLTYFQGYGNLGLKATYKRSGSGRAHLIGDSSGNLKFKLMG